MSVLGPRGLFLFTAVVQAALAGYVFHRSRVQAPHPAPDKTEFDFVATAPVGTVVTTEPIDPANPSLAVPKGYAPLDPNEAPEPHPAVEQHSDAL